MGRRDEGKKEEDEGMDMDDKERRRREEEEDEERRQLLEVEQIAKRYKREDKEIKEMVREGVNGRWACTGLTCAPAKADRPRRSHTW